MARLPDAPQARRIPIALDLAPTTGVAYVSLDGYASSPRATNARTCRREHLPGLLVQVGDGGVNCVGSWSCVRRAGIPRSLLSPPGEAPWPSVPMDHGVQRRERGGGQAGGPAARPDLAVPSAAAVPREISTCSASLLFRLSGPRAAACHGRFLCPSSSMRSAPGRPEVMRQPGAVSRGYPPCDAVITASARDSLLMLLSLSS